MRIAIVDDIDAERQNMTSLVEGALEEMHLCPCEISSFVSAEHYLNQNAGEKYDLIILDIFMDQLTGIDLAKKIREADKDVHIVFSSSSNDFAAESYNVCASYYIQKPVTKAKVVQMLEKVRIAQEARDICITLQDGQRMLVNEIVCAEYNNHLITVFCKNKGMIRTRMAFNQLVEILKPFSCFLVCNKGTLINMNEIEAVEKNLIKMSQGEMIPISRRRMNEVNARYQDFLFEMARKEMMQ